MIDEIVLSKTIDPDEHMRLSELFKNQLSDGTPAFFPRKESGIAYFTLWTPGSDVSDEWLHTVGTVNATIKRDSRFISKVPADLAGMLECLNGILSKYELNNPWLIRSMSFRTEITTQHADLYLKLIGRTDPKDISKLSKGKKVYNTDKETDMFGAPMTKRIIGYDFSNGISKVSFRVIDDKKLGFRVTVWGRDGFKKIPEYIGVRGRDIRAYDGKLEDVDDHFINYYLESVTGGGNYYGIREAEELIDSIDYISHKDKNKYLAVLEGIRRYRGRKNYLKHFDDPAGMPEDQKIIKNRNIAERMIKGLSSEAINPVTIPDREEASGIRMLPALSVCERT